MDILMPALFKLHCVSGPVGVLPNLNLVERLAVDVKRERYLEHGPFTRRRARRNS